MLGYLLNIKKGTIYDAAEIFKAASQSFVSRKSEAFETIYYQLAPKLMAICKLYSNDNDEGKDLMKESCIFLIQIKKLNTLYVNKNIQNRIRNSN